MFKALRIDGPKLHAVVINRLDEYIPEGLQTSRELTPAAVICKTPRLDSFSLLIMTA